MLLGENWLRIPYGTEFKSQQGKEVDSLQCTAAPWWKLLPWQQTRSRILVTKAQNSKHLLTEAVLHAAAEEGTTFSMQMRRASESLGGKTCRRGGFFGLPFGALFQGNSLSGFI